MVIFNSYVKLPEGSPHGPDGPHGALRQPTPGVAHPGHYLGTDAAARLPALGHVPGLRQSL